MAFKKGQSGNPKGRPKINEEVRALARKHTKDAIAALVHWAKKRSIRTASASVAAANALLDRGWGKPAQPMTGEDGEGPILVKIEDGWARNPPA